MSHNKLSNKKPKLKLKTKQNRKLNELHSCSNCRRKVNPIRQYYHSNRGRVYLCSSCDDVIRDRSFGKVDALDKARHLGHYDSRNIRKNWY